MMKNFDLLANVVRNVVRNSFGVCAVLETEPRMKKTANPYVGRVKKVTTYSNIALGRDYYAAVANAADRKGLDGKMEIEKPKGMTWSEYPYFLVSDKDAEQMYLRLTLNKNTTIKTTYMVDGREATAAEVEEIKTFLYDTSYSLKQAAVGLEETEQVRPMSVKVENIVKIWQGAKCYER